jgi:hypothetical protein
MVQQNTSGSMKLASSSQELASQAEALQQVIGRFQIELVQRSAPPLPPAVAFAPRRALALTK